MTAGALKVLMIPFLLDFRCVTIYDRFSSLDMLAICLFAEPSFTQMSVLFGSSAC